MAKPLRGETQLPSGPLRDKLEELSGQVDWVKPLGPAVKSDALAKALKNDVAGFHAIGAATAGSRSGGEDRAPVAVREYSQGQKTLRLKITDTAEAVELRQGMSGRLFAVGGPTSGDQQGAVFRGAPGVEAFHEQARVSRAVVVVRGRFLVEVIVRQTGDAQDARRVIEALDLSALAAPVR